MENPASWNDIEKTIAFAMTQHQQQMHAGIIGHSVVLAIYTALREKGMLNEPKVEASAAKVAGD